LFGLSNLPYRQKVLLYLIDLYNHQYGDLIGRKRLNKLLFLVEHYNPATNELVQTNYTGYTFVVGPWGPFPVGIDDDVSKLELKGLIEEEIVTADMKPVLNGIELFKYNDDGVQKAVRIYRTTKKYRLLNKLLKADKVLSKETKSKIEEIIEKYGLMHPDDLELFTKVLSKTDDLKKLDKCLGNPVLVCAKIQ